MSKPKLKTRYSGPQSEEFWDVIDKIENDTDRKQLYSLGCDLQNLENSVLRKLEEIKAIKLKKNHF